MCTYPFFDEYLWGKFCCLICFFMKNAARNIKSIYLYYQRLYVPDDDDDVLLFSYTTKIVHL